MIWIFSAEDEVEANDTHFGVMCLKKSKKSVSHPSFCASRLATFYFHLALEPPLRIHKEIEMLAFPNIKMLRNGEIGMKGCRQKKGMLGKLADIDVLARHVAHMLPTFPTKGLASYVRR